ncbi:MAG: amino acid ABC transporter substrate-binding protein [Ruminococcaceae bacterium]|nr:amino acid ABC transporter substrate-binding protein [Oscillospiraceae bacterium]
MKRTKLLSLVLAIIMLAAVLTACGGGAANGGNANDGETKKVLTVATNAEFPPFEYFEGEKIVGADIDMMEAIAEKMGVTLEITHIDFDAALTGAATGKYDIALSGITANDERRKNMAFTDDYYVASQAVIVMAEGEYKKVEDLAGKTISCQEGTTGEQYLLDNEYKVQSFKTGAEAISALTAGKVDAVVIDDAVAKALSEKQNGKTVVLDEPMTKENYAIATKLGNDELISEINAALAEIKADGTLAKIFEKYELAFDAE